MKKDREKGEGEGKKEKRGKKNQWKTKRTGDYRTIINLMTLLWRSTPEIFWAELFKCLQHKRVGGYTRLPPLLLPPPPLLHARSIPTRVHAACMNFTGIYRA